jgi:hypothetical protein
VEEPGEVEVEEEEFSIQKAFIDGKEVKYGGLVRSEYVDPEVKEKVEKMYAEIPVVDRDRFGDGAFFEFKKDLSDLVNKFTLCNPYEFDRLYEATLIKNEERVDPELLKTVFNEVQQEQTQDLQKALDNGIEEFM